MKVVLDCNVLVSAAISRSTCRQLLDEVALFHTLVYSRETLQEFLVVMKYAHLKPYYPRAKQIIKLVLRLGVDVRPCLADVERLSKGNRMDWLFLGFPFTSHHERARGNLDELG